MRHFTSEELDKHEQVLAGKVFCIERLPHFKLLLSEVKQLASSIAPGSTVVSLERGLLYGGYSLIGPFFHDHNFISIDCSPHSADERGSYNQDKITDPDFLLTPITHRSSIENTELEPNMADLVIIPNLVHHVANQRALFLEMARITKPGGQVFLFEPTVRELHQIPDDYVRYTPYGVKEMMADVDLNVIDVKLEGGPFSAVGYCWMQALEYFPEQERKEKEQWFYNEHLPQLLNWDSTYTHNQVRKHTKFPMSFSVIATKTLSKHKSF